MPIKRPCTECGEICFSRRNVPLCKSCSRIKRKIHPCTKTYKRYHHMNSRYGIDEKGFDILWNVCQGKCNICGKLLKLPLLQRGQPPDSACVDHDHKTGNIRGLLCNSCNKGIGLLKDNPELLLKSFFWVGGKLWT